MADGAPRVYAVIPAHNHVDQTLRCLQALGESTVVPVAVVIDDGSTDGTAAIVRREYADAVVLPGDGNLWWAGSTNLGVEYALDHGADFVWTFNNDGVADTRALECLLECERESRPSVVGSKLLDLARPDIILCTGGVVDWNANPFIGVLNNGERDCGGFDERYDCDFVPANSMLVPRACFEQIGLFAAAELPQGWADLDFQLRAAAAGWKLICEGRSVVWDDLTTTTLVSVGEGSLRRAATLLTSRRSMFHVRSVSRFFRRNVPRERLIRCAVEFYAPLASGVARHYSDEVKARIHAGLRAFGLDIIRYRPPVPAASHPSGPTLPGEFYESSPTCHIPLLSNLYETYFGRKTDGTFVEVGGFDGYSFSNSYGLAGAGWRGIYAEPVPEFAEQCRARYRSNPGVQTHQVAVGSSAGEAELFVAGPYSTVRPDVLEEYRSVMTDEGLPHGHRAVRVPRVTLDDLLESSGVAPEFEVLIVDVEGSEKDVLDGFDLQRWRPQMFVLELHDIHPLFTVSRREHADLMRRVLEYGYVVAYKDAVNTVFVTNELSMAAHPPCAMGSALEA